MSSGGASLNPPTSAAAQAAYDVGYAKPPKATQWKKGQSGNPAGKKPGSKNFPELFNKIAMKKVPVTLPNGKKTKKTLLELTISSVIAHAQAGKKAMKPIAAHLVEAQFHEPAEEPPMLGKIIKEDGKVYIKRFVSDDLMSRLDALIAAAKNLDTSGLGDDDFVDGGSTEGK